MSESWSKQLYKYLGIANTNAVTKNFMLQLYLLHDFCVVILKISYKLHIAVGITIYTHSKKIKNFGFVFGSTVS